MLFQFFKQTHKKNHIKNLLNLAKSDGFFHMNEYELLLVVARKYGLSISFIQNLDKQIESEDFTPPKKEMDKFRYWYDLINMVLADNVIHEKEIEFCEVMAHKFNYPQNFIHKTISKIQEGRSFEELYQTFSQEKDFI
ncbi:hypothetical protein AD998_06895 [bacterium 336/3]|jgi:hypothetical protein|nr:hypothetical protein AD998_06895 [bacterium 336/3]